ncbi:phage major capsid protein, P2 family [Roseateles flavus]|uniref:Phage major capsid protein, P2 family n=1 Tax=Roseateles flavus TaxID=3149041 RepID=A0ABV0GGB9_9BURK
MQNSTRIALAAYVSQLATLNGVSEAAVGSKFTVTPSVQQKLESRIQESSAFLKSINIVPVDEQAGETLGLMVTGPVAGTQDTDAGERQPRDISGLDSKGYRCEQINYDTFIKYQKLDAWAKFPDFQARLRDLIIQRIALDRMMIGFNGTSRAATSNRAANPLLQDVAKGWLQKIREQAPERHLKEIAPGSNKVKIGATGDYKTLDALVYDAVNDLIDPWYREDTQLVALTGRQLMADKYFPLVNTIQAPTEQIAANDLITSQKRVGNLPAVQVPFFPPKAILVTKLSNLSVYYQNGTQRRSVIDNPRRDRIETFQSSNDDFVMEDMGCCAFIENIELV